MVASEAHEAPRHQSLQEAAAAVTRSAHKPLEEHRSLLTAPGAPETGQGAPMDPSAHGDLLTVLTAVMKGVLQGCSKTPLTQFRGIANNIA